LHKVTKEAGPDLSYKTFNPNPLNICEGVTWAIVKLISLSCGRHLAGP